ncbi:MAG: hypothetical protein V2I82_15630 [Halieaceae bacterium]|nr:hypothetical protein [Halieaceae bacterium]
MPADGDALLAGLQLKAMIAAAVAATLCIVVIATLLRFPPAPGGEEPRGPLAMASLKDGRLIALTTQALLIHARSGLDDTRLAAADLGLQQLAPPLLRLNDGRLLVAGRVDEAAPVTLFRCDLVTVSCEVLMEISESALALAESYLGDAIFSLGASGRLARHALDGSLEAEAGLAAGPRPRLIYREGLLLIPEPASLLLGVHRSDRSAFGSQLDALFIAAPGLADGDSLRDVALVGGERYALIGSAEGSPRLFHFDADWGGGTRVDLEIDPPADAYLTTWRDRLLVASASAATAQRIAPGGRNEAPFASSMLAAEREAWLRIREHRQWLRRAGIVLPALLIALATTAALLYQASVIALREGQRPRSALLDPMPAGVRWLPAAPQREAGLRRTALLLALPVAIPCLVLGLKGDWTTLACLLPAALTAARATLLLWRGSGGHLGLRGGDLIAVDHEGRYFYGRASEARCGAGFLFAEPIALPLSVAGIDNFDADRLVNVATLDDRRAVLGRLWLHRHPWLLAVLLALGGWALSLALLLLRL